MGTYIPVPMCQKNLQLQKEIVQSEKLALSTWHHLQDGAQTPFEIWTDHKNLEMLCTPWQLGAKQLLWAEFISKFQFTLHHLPGKKNFLADALSRLPQHESKCEEVIDAMFSPS